MEGTLGIKFRIASSDTSPTLQLTQSVFVVRLIVAVALRTSNVTSLTIGRGRLVKTCVESQLTELDPPNAVCRQKCA